MASGVAYHELLVYPVRLVCERPAAFLDIAVEASGGRLGQFAERMAVILP